jgi:hypothetical protein
VFSTTLEQLQGRSTERNLRVASGDLFPAAQKSQEADVAFPARREEFQRCGSHAGRLRRRPHCESAHDSAAQSRKLGSTIAAFVSDARTAYETMAGNPASMTPEMQARIRDLASRTDDIKKSLQGTRDLFSRSLQDKLKA